MPSCTASNPSHDFVLVQPLCCNDDRAREIGRTFHFMTRHDLVLANDSGHFKDKNGVEIKVQSDRIPAYAYVICDTTKEVEIIAENKGLLPTPDNLGYFGYNQKLSAYVEVISYTKLLRDAKNRNRILFDKLHLPTHSS